MTKGNTNHSEQGEEKKPDDGRKNQASPPVALRPKSLDTKTWPRLTRLYLKDGTPIEDLMMR